MDKDIIEKKIKIHGLRDEADVIAYDAIAYMLHRQWLFDGHAGDRKMAVRHLGDVIRNVIKYDADETEVDQMVNPQRYNYIEREEDIDNNEPGDLSPEDEKLAEKMRRSLE